MINFISPEELLDNIDFKNLVIVDCRFNLMDKEYSKKSYDKEHIKNARRIDLETELASEVREHGGRHPLPSIDVLKDTFDNLGISNDSVVIAYDDGDLAGPSRLWWILKYLGHDEVYVLDGGISEYKKIGGKTDNQPVSYKKGNFILNANENLKVDMQYVREKLQDKDVVVIDSRENIRYIGEHEPVDKKAGHIPGALNYFWMDILKKDDECVKLKNKEELNKHFEYLRNYKEVIVYCGSGITACTNSLALNEIGIANKVYTGSFSDWISYNDNEIETN